LLHLLLFKKVFTGLIALEKIASNHRLVSSRKKHISGEKKNSNNNEELQQQQQQQQQLRAIFFKSIEATC